MHESLHISAYTPSNTDPEILEKMFVQREKLLSQTVKWCEESIRTKKKNHMIFIGPRGSGKTHFVSMAVNRLRAIAKKDKAFKQKLIVVWLGEDDVITNFIDLVLSILETLVRDYPNEFNKDCLKDAIGEKPDKAAEIILHSITKQTENKTILLIKENMSDVFSGLKDNGQKKFRAYLQEQRNINILATSQQLFEGVSSRDNAFFGFFDVHHLETLNVENARLLIKNIALINEDKELADYLDTPEGNYRIRALHHLAGGNHRLYVELSAFLTMESLDNFVSALSKLADKLTPYFQERVKSLPAQQGKIVQKLCELEGATPVKTIAEETFIEQRSVAKQLGELAKKGYVISHKRGKQSFYEMAEPLMRLSLEVKNNHGQPLKMVATLLRIWFSEKELSDDKNDALLAKYQQAALLIGNDIFSTINERAVSQLSKAIDEKDDVKALQVSAELLECNNLALDISDRISILNIRSVTHLKRLSVDLANKDYRLILDLLEANDTKNGSEDKIDVEKMLEVIHKFQEDPRYLIQFLLKEIIESQHSTWDKRISNLLSSPKQDSLLVHIGANLLLITPFLIDKESQPLFNKWHELWMKYGSKYPEIKAALTIQKAVIESIEQKTDKPLLTIPKEYRDVFMPLLKKHYPEIFLLKN